MANANNQYDSQFSDRNNGQPAAGTKEISKPAELLEAGTLQDGGASNKGYKQPAIDEQI